MSDESARLYRDALNSSKSPDEVWAELDELNGEVDWDAHRMLPDISMIHEKTLLEGRRPCPNCDSNVYYRVVIRGEDVCVEEFETFSPNGARDAGVKE